MDGLDILVRSLSISAIEDHYGNRWQYHPRSDRHSKIACWAIMFDLLRTSTVLARHVRDGKVVFGVNHKLIDFTTQKAKKLDLVVARPGAERLTNPQTFADLVQRYGIRLNPRQEADLLNLPTLWEGSVGTVLMALEAKAAMTEHVKALPRLYDELNSSHQIVHGHSTNAISAGFVMINRAPTFVSPDRNRRPLARARPEVNTHDQPRVTVRTIETVARIPRRSRVGAVGFDAIAIAVIECANDPLAPAPVRLVTAQPAPQPGEPFYYEDDLVRRVGHLYDTAFVAI